MVATASACFHPAALTDPYRNEQAQLELRVKELEDELAEAHTRIAQLEGRGKPSNFAERFFGGPLSVDVEHTVDGEIPPDAYEDALEITNNRLGGGGQVATVGRSFSYSLASNTNGRFVEVKVRPQNGKTTIRVRERFNQVAGGLFGGIVGGLGGGGLGGVIPLGLFLHLGALIPLLAVAWIAFVFLLVRLGYGAMVRKRKADLEALGAELRDACVERVRIAGPSGARIAAGADDAAATREAEAEAEAERAQPTARRAGSR